MGFGRVYSETPGPPLWPFLFLGPAFILSFVFLLHSWANMVEHNISKKKDQVEVKEEVRP